MSLQRGRVVITGIGLICPAGRNVAEYWDHIVAGKSAIGPLTSRSMRGLASPTGGEVPDAWLEHIEGIPKNLRVVKMALVAAWEAMASAGIDPATYGDDIGVVLGMCQLSRQTAIEPIDALSEALGFGRGPRTLISTACAAGSNAVGYARDRLWAGEARIMLAGGADVLMRATYQGFDGFQALSDGPCAPYSRSDGLNLGEGAAFLVVEPYEDAVARGAEVLAEVCGYGLSADAHHATAPDPSGRGPVKALRAGLAEGGIAPDEVDYVNGHGTGTPANDGMERVVMRSVFGDRASEVPISSTKSFIGHSLGASGAIEAVTCVLALRNDILPPTVNFDESCESDLDYVPNNSRPAKVDVTVSNNYAFGGNNCSLTLSKPRSPRGEFAAADDEVVVTGIGTIGGPGIGLEAWRQSWAEGRNPFGPITGFDTTNLKCAIGAEMVSLEGHNFARPNLWRHIDPLTKQAIAATRLAWQDAAFTMMSAERESAGLMFGTTFGPVSSALQFMNDAQRGSGVKVFSSVVVNAAAGAVCQALGLRGPTTTITSSGASGTMAISTAVDHIQLGKADVVVVVASDELTRQALTIRSQKGMLTERSAPRPFDTHRDGTLLGSASVALVLERRESAERRGARSYGQILSTRHGTASGQQSGSDGRNEDGLARVMHRALEAADSNPERVTYCASAASGIVSDAVEAEAYSRLFGDRTLVSAPKALTGECDAASGLISVVAALLAVYDGTVIPNPELTDPIADVPLAYANGHTTLGSIDHAVAVAKGHGPSFGIVVVGPPER